MTNKAQQEAMDRAGELTLERRVSERRISATTGTPASQLDAPAPPEVAVELQNQTLWNAIARLERQDSTYDERMAAADELRTLAGAPVIPAAVPVAAGLPAIPEGQTRHFFRQLSSFGPYVECLRTDEGAVEFAPVLPVEQPSQPQDQSGSIRHE